MVGTHGNSISTPIEGKKKTSCGFLGLILVYPLEWPIILTPLEIQRRLSVCFVRIGYIIVEKFGSNYYIARKFWRKKKEKKIKNEQKWSKVIICLWKWKKEKKMKKWKWSFRWNKNLVFHSYDSFDIFCHSLYLIPWLFDKLWLYI